MIGLVELRRKLGDAYVDGKALDTADWQALDTVMEEAIKHEEAMARLIAEVLGRPPVPPTDFEVLVQRLRTEVNMGSGTVTKIRLEAAAAIERLLDEKGDAA